MIATERLYLNKDKSKAVKEGDKEAAFLLAGKGCEIPREYESHIMLMDMGKQKKEQPKPQNKEKEVQENKGFKTEQSSRRSKKSISFGGSR